MPCESCSICRGVPRVDPMSFVTSRQQPTIAELLQQAGELDVHEALKLLLVFQMLERNKKTP